MKTSRVILRACTLAAVAAGVYVLFENVNSAPRDAADARQPAVVREGTVPAPADSQLAGTPQAGPQPRRTSVFRDASRAMPAHPEAGILRQRMVRVDTASLQNAVEQLSAGARPDPVAIELFDDTQFQVQVVHGEQEPARGRLVLSGRVVGEPHSQVVFAERDGFVHGVIFGRAGIFSVEPAGTDGVHRVSEKILEGTRSCVACDFGPEHAVHQAMLDTPMMANEPKPQVLASALSAPSSPSLPAAATFTDAELINVDVMVLWTRSAKFRWAFNLDSQVLSKIDAIVEQANDVFARSGTRVRVRLAHAAEIDFEENLDQDANIEAIATDPDIQALRNEHAADLVMTLVRNEPQGNKDHAAGFLQQTNIEHENYGDDAANNEYWRAWSLSQYNNILEWMNFVHNIGHGLGCAHNVGADPVEGAFSYSVGYIFQVGADEKITVMATGNASKLVPYFSNPDLTYDTSGVPLGVPPGQPGESDCRLTINKTAFEVSQYRLEKLAGPATQRLINVSTRGWVGTDSSQMIGGFVLTGTAPQDLIIRGQGPGLAQFGVQGVLPDPKITVLRGSEEVAMNDDWQSNDASMVTAITNSGYQPEDAKEPALFLTLDPGAYTCVLGGNGETPTGVGIFELFALQDGAPRVVNLSTRGYVGTGEQGFIAGFVISGDPGETRRVVIRVVGPTLATFGVEGAMQDPHLRLFDGKNNLLYINEDSNRVSPVVTAALDAVQLRPDSDLEPAMIVDLKPGAYTAIASPYEEPGVAPMPGVGLVEVYEIMD